MGDTYRIFIGAWLIWAFIIVASYGGNLRAFLLYPSYSEPLDTLQRLADKGITAEVHEYGNQIEAHIEQSKDPVLQKVWGNRKDIPYQEFPMEPVRESKAWQP